MCTVYRGLFWSISRESCVLMLPESFFDFLFNIVVYLAFALPLYFYCTPYVDAISTADLLEYDEASTDVDQQGEDTLHSPVASSPIKISADDVASSFQKTHQRARSHTDSEGFFEEVSSFITTLVLILTDKNVEFFVSILLWIHITEAFVRVISRECLSYPHRFGNIPSLTFLFAC